VTTSHCSHSLSSLSETESEQCKALLSQRGHMEHKKWSSDRVDNKINELLDCGWLVPHLEAAIVWHTRVEILVATYLLSVFTIRLMLCASLSTYLL
jgi:hypothetical protein